MDVIERLESMRESDLGMGHVVILNDAIVEIRRLRAEVERLRTPDMFWDRDNGYAYNDWKDALDGAPALDVLCLDTAHNLGSRYVVHIPRAETSNWRADCHLFNTREEAEAAVAKVKGAE